jgi:hypothetical protein
MKDPHTRSVGPYTQDEISPPGTPPLFSFFARLRHVINAQAGIAGNITGLTAGIPGDQRAGDQIRTIQLFFEIIDFVFVDRQIGVPCVTRATPVGDIYAVFVTRAMAISQGFVFRHTVVVRSVGFLWVVVLTSASPKKAMTR